MSKGAHHNESRSGSKKGKVSRGSVDNARRLEAFSERAGHGDADWGNCNPQRLQSVVVAITGLGGAVTFGLSRDQGAHSLTLMLDGERQTLWYNGDADLDEKLLDVMGILEGMLD